MDAVAQLALMSKAKLIFESADTFLSFPALTPISYTPEQLKFNGPNPSYGPLVEFSQFTNSIPKGVLFQPDTEVHLWDVYADLFKNAHLARGTLTPGEQAAYQQALALLYVTGPDGLRTLSPTLVAYNSYRDGHIHATEEYKNAQLDATLSPDAAVKDHWEKVDEPALRQRVNQAMHDWMTLGFKAQVEQAQAVELQCAAKSPLTRWTEWASSFNPDVDMTHDPATTASGAITGFSPIDVLDRHDWPTFRLTASDIAQLVSQAPPELRNTLGSGSASSDIESITFEFRSVALTRPWFRSAVFDARFWRFDGPEPPISNGATPPTGQCPAYATAVVFARNISITAKAAGGAVQPQPVKKFPVLSLQNAAVKQQLLTNMSNQMMFVQPVAKPVTTVNPALTVSPAMLKLKAVSFAAAPASAQSFAVAAASPLMTTVAFRPGTIAVQPINATTGAVKTGASTGQAGTATGQTTPPSRDISILAFICKRVKRCPDPDPALTW